MARITTYHAVHFGPCARRRANSIAKLAHDIVAGLVEFANADMIRTASNAWYR